MGKRDRVKPTVSLLQDIIVAQITQMYATQGCDILVNENENRNENCLQGENHSGCRAVELR